MDQLRSAVTWLTRRGARHTGVSLAASGIVLVALVAVVASVNAWRARPEPLAHTYPSLDAMARVAISAAGVGDAGALRDLALTEDEFRAHVWPLLPASRPERNVPFEFVWGTLHQNSEGHLRQSLRALGGREMTLVRAETVGETTDYGGVVVHRDTRLVVKDAAGQEQTVRLFGSVVERRGRYKIFSFIVD